MQTTVRTAQSYADADRDRVTRTMDRVLIRPQAGHTSLPSHANPMRSAGCSLAFS